MLPVTIGAFNGARSSEQALVWSARSMGQPLRMLWDVVVPSAMPELLNGIRTALALSFILLVSSELIVAQQGFGYLIGFLGANGTYDAMFAVVLTVAFLGFAADRLYLLVMRTAAAMAGMSRRRAWCTARAMRRDARSGVLRALGWGLARIFSIVVLALAWEWFARSGAVTPFMLPALSAVLERIWSDARVRRSRDQHRRHALPRHGRIAIAAVAGIVLGMAMSRGRSRTGSSIRSSRSAFPMPKIAFLPVVILWLGVYDVSKISMVVLDAIFPVVTATVIGIRGVERELLWSARNMGAGEREILWQIALPAALPQIITGLQVALPIALIVAVVTEMLMGGYGLGGAMMTASRFADLRGVFAGIVEIAVVGYVLVKGMAIVRRRLLLWHQEALTPSTV